MRGPLVYNQLAELAEREWRREKILHDSVVGVIFVMGREGEVGRKSVG